MRPFLLLLLVVSASLARPAAAAPTDCQKNGGQMICADPVIVSENISLCDETGAYLFRANMAGTCGWGSPTPTVGAAISKMACFEAGLTGCSSSPNWPGWSVPGQSHASNFCWSLTTTKRNGITINEFAVVTSTTISRDSNGNCTRVGGFTAPITAWKQRTLACPAGYNTGSFPNGDYKCFKCPPNSTWNGANCVCNMGYVPAPDVPGLCIEACQSDADCNQGDYCAGREVCISGYCVQTPKPMCKDALVCTLDRCDSTLNACVNELDPTLCTCNVPVDLKAQASAQLKLPPVFEVACPRFVGGGSVGVALSAKTEFEKTLATCANGCEGSSSVGLEVTASLKACSKPYTAQGTLKSQYKERHCQTCTGNCVQQCEGPSCDTRTVTGGLKKEIEPEIKAFSKHAKVGSFNLGVNCSGSYLASVGTEVEYEGTSPTGGFTGGKNCAGCTDCQSVNTKVTGGGGIKGGCEVGVLPPLAPPPNGSSLCLACLEGTVSGTGDVKGKWGTCAAETCYSGRVDAELKADLAKVQLQYGWFKVSGSCKFLVKGCGETNSCGTCACKNCGSVETDLGSCSVKFGADFDKGKP